MPTLKLEPLVSARLIDRLSSDDDYRSRFVGNPAAALAEIGHIADISALDAFLQTCFVEVKLADKETIGVARDDIYRMLTRGTDQSVPMLDANFSKNRVLKAVKSAA